MKNILTIIVFCMVGVGVFAQQKNSKVLKTESISVDRSTEPLAVSATAEKADGVSDTKREETTLTVVHTKMEKTNSRQENLTPTSELAIDNNISSRKKTNIEYQRIEMRVERESAPLGIKSTAKMME